MYGTPSILAHIIQKPIMSTLKSLLLWISCYLLTINAQTDTKPPSSAPTRCISNGRAAADCEDARTPSPTPESITAPPISQPQDRGTKLPSMAPSMPTTESNLPTPKPTNIPLRYGRDPAITKTPPPTTSIPTSIPKLHDQDTDYPSKSPTQRPTVFGETHSPTPDTLSPSLMPSANPTFTPSHNPTGSHFLYIFNISFSF